VIGFTVVGDPKTKGSSRGFIVAGRVRITNACKDEKPWAQNVHWTAREVKPDGAPWEGPINLTLDFVLKRPKRLGKKRVFVLHDKTPDADKLARSAIDALTGVFFHDDSQVAALFVRKRYANYGDSPCMHVVIERMEEAV